MDSNPLNLMMRLVTGLVPGESGGEWERRLDDVGFEEWEASPALDGTERRGLVHSQGGVTVRTINFQESFTPSDHYPEGWPYVTNERASLFEVEGEGFASRAMLWIAPRDPEAVWSILVEEHTARGAWCQSEWSPPVPEVDSPVRIRAAIALWRHPEHREYRTLIWYEMPIAGVEASIALSDILVHPSAAAADPPPDAG